MSTSRPDLSPAGIRRAVQTAATTGRDVVIRDPGSVGLRLIARPGGTVAWHVSVTDPAGRARRIRIPGDARVVPLTQARRDAIVLRSDVQRGRDPAAERRAARAREKPPAPGPTLADVWHRYGVEKGRHLRSWRQSERRVRQVFARLMARPIAGIALREIQDILDAMPSKSSAKGICGALRPCLKWASAPARAACSRELSQIEVTAPTTRRDRVLSADELARLLPVLHTQHGAGSRYATVMLLLLLTGARRDEIGELRMGEIAPDLSVLTIGAQRMKGKKPHVIPLSRQAQAILADVIPADRPDASTLVFPNRDGNHAIGAWDRETKRIQAMSETEGWTRHDLRRTAATLMADLGEMNEIIEIALAHKLPGVAGIYNRSRRTDQVAEALQRLADRLDIIGNPGGNVIPLRSAAQA
ncbi:MAG: tyrosine-type recombinase/integrase [Acetobacteraceae bacterium]